MAVLTKDEIIHRFGKGELVRNPMKDAAGQYRVEPASYDLHAGVIIWKEEDSKKKRAIIKQKTYDPARSLSDQDLISLQPGQVMFVVTYEDINMPKDLCGTVYAKNRFSRDGIMALTTGHVDPGVSCPIVIRLINLRSIPYTFRLGEPIYTIVFQQLQVNEYGTMYGHTPISRQDTIARTVESANAALGNALHDISLTSQFVKRDEHEKLLRKIEQFVKKEDCGKEAQRYFIKSLWGLATIVFAILGVIASVVKIIEYLGKK